MALDNLSPVQRREFLQRLSFLSAALVGGCASGAGLLPKAGGSSAGLLVKPGILNKSNETLFANMRRFGVSGFFDGKNYVVLPEFVGKPLFPKQRAKPDCGGPLSKRWGISPDACGSGGPGGLTIIATVVCTAGGSVSVGVDDGGATDVNVQGTWFNTSGSFPGPMYSLSTPVPTNCIGPALETAGNTISAIASWCVANAKSLAAELAEEAGWLIAGEITAAEFGALALATLSAPELLLCLAAIGASIAAIAAIVGYIKCESGN